MSTNEQAEARAVAIPWDPSEWQANNLRRKGFDLGWDALLARLSDPDDALADSAGRALYENRVAQVAESQRDLWPSWNDLERGDADEWRDAARAALAAVAARLAGGEK